MNLGSRRDVLLVGIACTGGEIGPDSQSPVPKFLFAGIDDADDADEFVLGKFDLLAVSGKDPDHAIPKLAHPGIGTAPFSPEDSGAR